MKFFLFVVFFGLSLSILAQTPKGLKYDQLIYSHDSLTALVIKGKTSGIYNFQKNEFSVEPSKNIFFNFPQTNAYAEFSAKDRTISMHWISSTDYFFVKGSDSSCYIGFSEETSGSLVNLNGRVFDKLNGDFAAESQDQEKLETLVKIERLDMSYFLITNFQAGYINTSIDTYIPGFNLSGIYDFNHKKYVIEPIYKHCYTVNQFVFCLKETQIYEDVIQAGLPEFNYTYDIYALRKDTALYDFYYEDVTELDQSKMEEVLAVGFSITYSEDGKHCIYPFEGKYGFAKFQLFDDAEKKIPHFVFQNILPPIYDFIAFSNEFQKVITLKDYGSQKLELHHIFYGDHEDSLQYLYSSRTSLGYFDRDPALLEDNFLVSTDSISSIELDSSGFFRLKGSDQAKPLSFPNFGITILDDSLLIIHNYRDEILADFPFVTSNGDDSVAYHWDGSPYFVYPIEADYFGHSGVFDLKAGDWRISPGVVTISGGKSGFIYRHPVRIDNDLTKVFFSYAISQGHESGNWRFIDKTTFENDPMLYRYAYNGLIADTVFEAPNGFFHHKEYENENSKTYYMSGNKQMGIYSPGNDFLNQVTDETFEFLHYNQTLEVYFYLAGDSIYFSSPFCNAAVSKKSGKIIFEQPDIYGDPVYMYQLTLIEGKNTIIKGESLNEYETRTTCSIEIIGDALIVNDHSDYVEKRRLEEFIGEAEMITDKIIFESENSSVWKKNTHGTWLKISPYYAGIEKIPNDLFIANSGYYMYEIDSYNGPSDPKGKTIDARYFILDSNLRVKSYMDYFDFAYIEDLGFGLKVQLNDGDKFFFMTYDLVAVTDAEWDRFELENGKLKAIIDTQYEEDPETGEPIYNEYGTPNEIVSSTTKYFKLP
ncbi:MAG: hypothetical protein IPH24_05550 [Crocinitomicaceae bacterium]|nr:hypothetical protein [Crocinitomicaceae bacterium]